MNAVKSLGDGRIEGLAIPFTSDVDGEDFGPDTDLCLDWFGPSGRPVLYHHGFDPALKTAIIGRQVEYETREEGIWVKAELDKAAKYRKAIDDLIAQGALGFSSGAIDHLSTKSASGHITRWPWMELSLTPLPAHHETTVYAVKATAAVEHLRAVDIKVPEPLEAALKALESWAIDRDAVPGSEPFTDRLVRVSDELRGLTDHAGQYVQMRVKAGRVLSTANRERIAAAVATRQALIEAYDELERLLSETDPDAGKSLDAAIWEALQTQARLNGVLV